MTKTDLIIEELTRRKKILEDKGYNVLYIGLHGSQNYNLDDEASDIDCKAIILPSLHDIIFRKVTSTTIELEDGHIDVKDLLTFYDVVKKGNFSFVESINTIYWLGEEYIKNLFLPIEANLKSMLGAMYEKRKALTHEYPSKHEEFQKWGYDPKQHHHILRLYDILYFINQTDDNVPYLTYMEDSNRRKELINYKRNKNNVALSIVEKDSDEIIERAKLLIPENYKYEPINLDEEINTYIETKIKEELNGGK